MRNSYQLTLYLRDGIKYKEDELANKLKNAIPSLKDPMIMSENANFPVEANAPILVFVQNNDFQFIGNYYFITINIFGDELIRYKENLIKVVNVLSELDFYRIGYVVNKSIDCRNIIEFKRHFFSQDELIDSNDFELSWLQDIEIVSKKVNCWKRYFTDRNINEKLNIIIDINTHEKEENQINLEFIEKFIDEADKYIDENVLFINEE